MVISKNITSFELFVVGRILIGFTAGRFLTFILLEKKESVFSSRFRCNRWSYLYQWNSSNTCPRFIRCLFSIIRCICCSISWITWIGYYFRSSTFMELSIWFVFFFVFFLLYFYCQMNSCTNYLQYSSMYFINIYTWNAEISSTTQTSTSSGTRLIIDFIDQQKNEINFLALTWFRCETDLEVVRAEIHEMEADFHNLQTNTTRVMIREIN